VAAQLSFVARSSSHRIGIVLFFELRKPRSSPGFIETPMTKKLTDDQVAKSLDSIPLHRFGKPSEVASMVRFLAIDEGAEYITGHCFDVDGGVGIAAS
jgi:Enoyl-(Acyl carrier protein) reductase